MFQLTPVDFDFTQGNENPLSELSLGNQVTHLMKAKDSLNLVIFNHNKKEFYISRTNVIRKRLRTWLNLLLGMRYAGGIPDVLYYSLSQECLSKICICVTEDTDKTLEILGGLERQGWNQLSKQHKQARMKTKPVNLYKVVDDTTGFTRYTLSAGKSNGDITKNVRLSAIALACSKRLSSFDGFEVIRAEIERIAEKKLFNKVKTTHIYHIRDSGVMDVCEKDFAKQVARLNDVAFDDWLKGPYVKALINKEGVLNREA